MHHDESKGGKSDSALLPPFTSTKKFLRVQDGGKKELGKFLQRKKDPLRVVAGPIHKSVGITDLSTTWQTRAFAETSTFSVRSLKFS